MRRAILLFILVVFVGGLTYITTKSPTAFVEVTTVAAIVGALMQIEPLQRWVVDVVRDILAWIGNQIQHPTLWMTLCGILCVALILVGVAPHLPRPWPWNDPGVTPTATITPICLPPSGLPVTSSHLGVTRTLDGQLIGISDGKDFFDASLSNEKLKEQAKQAKNSTDAQTRWMSAHGLATNDAESAIYEEDLRVLDTTIPYIDIVIGVTFMPNQIGLARDILQGAYIAQLEFNQSHQDLQVRLLIANSGNGHAKEVTCQIIYAAHADPMHIVGVMGWSISQDTLDSVELIDKAQLPMVAATSSSTLLHDFPYFSRVNPSDELQGWDGADYAKQQLKVHKVVVFEDPSNAYAGSLADAFEQRFSDGGGSILARERYTVGQSQTVLTALQDAQRYNPDLYYFAGYASDAGTLLENMSLCPPSPTTCSPLVLSGSALYIYGDYANKAQARANFASGRMYFTAFADPDKENGSFAKFLTDYGQSFGSAPINASPYGYTRPDADTMLAFDAVSVLATSCDSLKQITPANLHKELAGVTGYKGITGIISFGSNGNPVNKEVLMLHVDNNGYTQIAQTWGQAAP